LTYRFSFAAFWSVLALSDIPLPAPLSLGIVKGLLLRHLRWWSKQEDIFYSDGTLSIGFCFPNMYMSEDYNSPQSVYWCFKTFCAVALPETHEFWTCEELPHPLAAYSKPESSDGSALSQPGQFSVAALDEPKQILVSSSSHHYLLSSGQFCPWPLKATEAKYCKFAYSSAFAFSVPTGTLIQQIAPDSTLAISEDDGDTWRVRWKSSDANLVLADLYVNGAKAEQTHALTSLWSPSRSSSLKIKTTLIAPTSRWPDWSIRVHRIAYSGSAASHEISTVEGGFAISGRRTDGRSLPAITAADLESRTGEGTPEGVWDEGSSSLILSPAGVSGISQLRPLSANGVVLHPDSNTNLISQRTLIPTVKQKHIFSSGIEGELILVVGIFCLSSSNGFNMSAQEILKRWIDMPVICLTGEKVEGIPDFIEVGL
jgi:hypothetical protein